MEGVPVHGRGGMGFKVPSDLNQSVILGHIPAREVLGENLSSSRVLQCRCGCWVWVLCVGVEGRYKCPTKSRDSFLSDANS